MRRFGNNGVARLRAALLLCMVVLPAAAEDPKPERRILATIPDDWKAFKPGSWVESRITTTGVKIPPVTVRTKLLEPRDGYGWISTLTTSDPKAKPGESPTDATWVSEDSFEPSGEEDVKVGSASLHCRVWKAKAGAKDGTSGSKVWICPESRELGGLVKMENWQDTGSWTTSSVTELVETDREVEVLGRKVRAYVIRAVETRNGENYVWTLEELHSPEVPGGMVKRTNLRKEKTPDGEREVTSVEEITAIHIEGGEWTPTADGGQK